MKFKYNNMIMILFFSFFLLEHTLLSNPNSNDDKPPKKACKDAYSPNSPQNSFDIHNINSRIAQDSFAEEILARLQQRADQNSNLGKASTSKKTNANKGKKSNHPTKSKNKSKAESVKEIEERRRESDLTVNNHLKKFSPEFLELQNIVDALTFESYLSQREKIKFLFISVLQVAQTKINHKNYSDLACILHYFARLVSLTNKAAHFELKHYVVEDFNSALTKLNFDFQPLLEAAVKVNVDPRVVNYAMDQFVDILTYNATKSDFWVSKAYSRLEDSNSLVRADAVFYLLHHNYIDFGQAIQKLTLILRADQSSFINGFIETKFMYFFMHNRVETRASFDKLWQMIVSSEVSDQSGDLHIKLKLQLIYFSEIHPSEQALALLWEVRNNELVDHYKQFVFFELTANIEKYSLERRSIIAHLVLDYMITSGFEYRVLLPYLSPVILYKYTFAKKLSFELRNLFLEQLSSFPNPEISGLDVKTKDLIEYLDFLGSNQEFKKNPAFYSAAVEQMLRLLPESISVLLELLKIESKLKILDLKVKIISKIDQFDQTLKFDLLLDMLNNSNSVRLDSSVAKHIIERYFSFQDYLNLVARFLVADNSNVDKVKFLAQIFEELNWKSSVLQAVTEFEIGSIEHLSALSLARNYTSTQSDFGVTTALRKYSFELLVELSIHPEYILLKPRTNGASRSSNDNKNELSIKDGEISSSSSHALSELFVELADLVKNNQPVNSLIFDNIRIYKYNFSERDVETLLSFEHIPEIKNILTEISDYYFKQFVRKTKRSSHDVATRLLPHANPKTAFSEINELSCLYYLAGRLQSHENIRRSILDYLINNFDLFYTFESGAPFKSFVEAMAKDFPHRIDIFTLIHRIFEVEPTSESEMRIISYLNHPPRALKNGEISFYTQVITTLGINEFSRLFANSEEANSLVKNGKINSEFGRLPGMLSDLAKARDNRTARGVEPIKSEQDRIAMYVAQNFLREMRCIVLDQSNPALKLGYDLKAYDFVRGRNLRVEVKSIQTQKNNNHLYISRNETNVANKSKEDGVNYFLLVVEFDGAQVSRVRVIKNIDFDQSRDRASEMLTQDFDGNPTYDYKILSESKLWEQEIY